MSEFVDQVTWAICAQMNEDHDPARPKLYPPTCKKCPARDDGAEPGCRFFARLAASAALLVVRDRVGAALAEEED